jgi:hypothetical protein
MNTDLPVDSRRLVVLGGNCPGAWQVLAKILETTRVPSVPGGLLSMIRDLRTLV